MPGRNTVPASSDAGQTRVNDISVEDYPARRQDLLHAFRLCREHSLDLARPLSAEDQMLQSMADASPVKWHLAHTTWFYETFILAPHQGNFRAFDESFAHLFNSYYNGVGTPFRRPDRGMLSRPSLERVHQYRQDVDRRVEHLLTDCDDRDFSQLAPLLVLGLNHEQQHQELMLADVKHGLFQNPTHPAYRAGHTGDYTQREARWLAVSGGMHTVGYAGSGFRFDNEGPMHEVLIQPFQISDRQVTNQEWQEFMDAGGYQDPLLWLSDGWAWKQAQGVSHPLYWISRAGDWMQFTLHGLKPLQAAAPVTHISYYEADAFARWSGARLPTEFEWEVAAMAQPELGPRRWDGLGLDSGEFSRGWQWTASAYSPYPGYRAPSGAIGEYNGKFMVNQMTLRGCSAATPAGHSRITYRNFFYPSARWQFIGLRLAHDS